MEDTLVHAPSRTGTRRPGARGAAFLLGLSLLGACRLGGDDRPSSSVGSAKKEPQLNIDFGLRYDLELGKKSVGDLIHLNVDDDFLGIADLVETSFLPRKVTVSLGVADGTFIQSVELSTIGHPLRLAAGDFNGDGNVDLAVANVRWPAKGPGGTGTPSVQVFLQRAAEPGQFEPPVDFLTGANPTDLTSAPISGVPGDPGPDELFVALRGSTSVNQIRLSAGPGSVHSLVQTGTLNSSNLGPAGGPFTVAVVDFDDDGRLDVAVGEDEVPGGSDRLVRYHRKADLSFDGAEFVLGPLFQPVVDNVGDVDGDGKEDLAVAQMENGRVYLLRFDGSGNPVATQLNLGAATTSLIFRDLNGDGLAEAICTTLHEDSIQVLPSTAPLAWGPAVHYSVGPLPRAIDVIFLPGDSVPDLLCANAQDLSVLVGQPGPGGVPTGRFRAARGYSITPDGHPTKLTPSALRIADLDGDSDLDAVVISRGQHSIAFLEGAGDGTFVARKALPLVASPSDKPGYLVIRDFDQDGKLDVVATIEANDTVRLYRGTGSVAGFASPAAADRTPVGEAPLGVDAANMDNANGPDVVVCNSGDDTLQVLLNNGDGTFTPQAAIPVSFTPGGVILADFNNDNTQDAAVAGWDTNDNWLLGIFSGDGAGGLAFVGSYPLPGGASSFAVADFDKNTLADIAVGQFERLTDHVPVFRNVGALTFGTNLIAAGTGPAHVMSHDANNDGKLDLVIATAPGELKVRLGNGTGLFPKVIPAEDGQLPLGPRITGAALGDVNGDGLRDIVTCSNLSTMIWVGLNTSTPVVGN